VRQQDWLIDYDQIEALRPSTSQDDHRRRLGHPAPSSTSRLREIADTVGAYPAGRHGPFRRARRRRAIHPNPFPHAHVATTTTHKTLRGPRGGMILTNDEATSPRNSTRPSSPASRAAR
jgi:glycine hydroxymethyltransferase